MSVSQRTLPRLLVVSDVAVERTGAGSLLLYRLLDGYPKEALRIFYREASSRGAEKRLPGVEYLPLDYHFPRYIANRLNPFWPIHASLLMRRLAARVVDALGQFEPEAVVSVANGYLWFTAHAVADRRQIPLHLFLHEDWPHLVTQNRSGRKWDMVRAIARMRVRPIYGSAVSRFSVSRGMVEEMASRYGLPSELVYPNRGADSPVARVRVQSKVSRPPVVAHTGFIHLEGNAALLRQLAAIMRDLGGHLDLYTMHSDRDLDLLGLSGPVVRNVGFFPAREMADRIAETAQAVFLSASFNEADRSDVSTLFPSKLADYTAIGLPIVAWGPRYSSAMRWCAETAGSALAFESPDPEPVRAGLKRVFSDEAFAVQLAHGAVEAGRRYFDHDVALEKFLKALCAPNEGRRDRAAKH